MQLTPSELERLRAERAQLQADLDDANAQLAYAHNHHEHRRTMKRVRELEDKLTFVKRLIYDAALGEGRN